MKRDRVRIVLPYEDSYLLERLSNPDWPDNFGKRRHVGGGLEIGEMPEQAASREIREELDIYVDPLAFRYLGKHEHQHYVILEKHNLTPGRYKASEGSDPFIFLEKGLPEGEDYMGPNLNIFGL